LQRVEDVGDGHAHRPDLGPVDVRVELGRPGAEAVEHLDEAGLLIALGSQVIRLGLQCVEVDVAGRFHHQLEAAGVAQAGHRRPPEDEHASPGDLPPKACAELSRDGLAAQRRIPALLEGREDNKHSRVVRADGVQDERPSREARRVDRTRCVQGNPFDRRDRLSRALQ
jgi:hypothetical protein